MGLVHTKPEQVLAELLKNEQNTGDSDIDAAWIENLIEERKTAKATKNWARADEIRKEVGRALTKQGVQFIFGTKVEEAMAGPGGATLTLSNGDTLSPQVCIVAVGRQPVSEPLQQPIKVALLRINPRINLWR